MGPRVCDPGSWGMTDSRDQRPRLGKVSPNAKCLGSRGLGSDLPEVCRVPGSECIVPVARPQQQPSTLRPCCSHCCLPQGPCSTCAAAGQPAAAPALCSLAVRRHKGPLQGVAAGSWLQLGDLGGAQPGGHVAVLLHLSRHHSRHPHLLQCCQQACPTALAPQHLLQPLQGACDRAAGPRAEPGFEETPWGWLLQVCGFCSLGHGKQSPSLAGPSHWPWLL